MVPGMEFGMSGSRALSPLTHLPPEVGSYQEYGWRRAEPSSVTQHSGETQGEGWVGQPQNRGPRKDGLA